MSTLYPPIQGWDPRSGFEEPAPLRSSQVPLHPRESSAKCGEAPTRGSCISTGRWAKVMGDHVGPPLWPQPHCSSPGAAFSAPFSFLVWVLRSGTAYRAWHRGVSPSLEPADTTPTQMPRGDESIPSSRLIHDTATSQIRSQKGLSLSILNKAHNDDPVAQ